MSDRKFVFADVHDSVISVHSRERRGQGGFTLIELMIVVAIIAVLAAVIIPSWTKESRRGKYDPEVRAVFSEISVKEEQYKSETGNGAYAALGTCPAAPSQTGVDLVSQTCYTGLWPTVRVAPAENKIRCTYAVTIGPANTAGSSPAVPVGSTFTLPSNSATYVAAWYYIVATCDMDGQGGTNATFFTASWDQSIQKMNYGS